MEVKKDTLYIIMPAYNEEANIAKTVEQWYPIVSSKNEDSRLLIVNDGSKDKTAEELEQLAIIYPKLLVINKKNEGHGPTVLSGYRYAIENGADYILQTDSDGQTDPEEFDRFWERREKYLGVFGMRKERGDGKQRWFVEKCLCLLLRAIFHVSVPDANCPYRLFQAEELRRQLMKIPDDYNLPNVILTVLYAKKHACKFVDVTFKPRQGGKNSINLRKIVKIGWQAVKDFRKFKKII